MSIVIENGNPTPLSIGDQWTPKLRGKIFCSPACGFGCKKVDFDRATEQATSLANQLGGGWEPHVWENCGWYFEVQKRTATVSVERDGQYEASVRFCFDEAHELCISEIRVNPRDAVEAVIEVLKGKIIVLNRSLQSLSLDPLEIQDI